MKWKLIYQIVWAWQGAVRNVLFAVNCRRAEQLERCLDALIAECNQVKEILAKGTQS